MKVKAFLLQETDNAMRVANKDLDPTVSMWVPRSICTHVHKHPKPAGHLTSRRVDLTMESWWVNKPANVDTIKEFDEL